MADDNRRRLERVKLNKMTKSELLDLRKRQDALLANKKFVDRLPDKGAKLIKLRSDIDAAISKLESFSSTIERVQRLTITNPTKNQVTLDDDDDDINHDVSDQFGDVLKTLASNRRPEKILIHTGMSFESKPQPKVSVEDSFVDDMTRKLEEKQRLAQQGVPERLKFNKSVTDTPTNFERHRANYFVEGVWIETGVTPPPAKFAEAKQISFQESYTLQKEQAEKQSELQFVQSAMHLAERMNLCRIDGASSDIAPLSTVHDDDWAHSDESQPDSKPDVTDDEN